MNYSKQGLHGYYVRIQRDGKQYASMFSVSKCGSMEKALAEAINYRDHILERWEKFCDGKNETIQYQTTNTGYPGISLSHSDGHPVLEINLREDGVQKGRTLALPPKESPNYEQAFEEQFAKAKSMVDEYNRKRFGGTVVRIQKTEKNKLILSISDALPLYQNSHCYDTNRLLSTKKIYEISFHISSVAVSEFFYL